MLPDSEHAKVCLSWMLVLRRRIVLELMTPNWPKLLKWGPKICFWGEVTLNGKFQNFAPKRTVIHVFLPSFEEVGKADVAKTMRGICHRKNKLWCEAQQTPPPAAT